MLSRVLIASAVALLTCTFSLFFLADEGAITNASSVGLVPEANSVPLTSMAPMVPISQVSAKRYTQCAITLDGAVKCWGDGGNGQVGNGYISATNTLPQDVSGITSGVLTMTQGVNHTCAILSTGAKCWGHNLNGELGNGSTSNSAVPVNVTVLPTVPNEFALGFNFTCARLGGGVRCWGNNPYGQLGNGTTTNSTAPVTVSGLAGNVIAMAAGDSHVCAVLEAGTVQCWGADYFGQLGDGKTLNSSKPVTVTGLLGVLGITGGAEHTCALLLSGGVKCWGRNYYGQLGDNTNYDRHAPVDVSGLASGVSAVRAGAWHTCALLNGGAVQCWGNNTYGQLGTGTTTSSWVPTNVIGLASSAIDLAAGDRHNCIALAIGGVQCWGENSTGALGNGTTSVSTVPVSAIGFGNDPVSVLTRTATPSTLVNGKTVTYTVTFSNGTPFLGLLTVVTDTLSPGGTFITTTAASDINASNSIMSPASPASALDASVANSPGTLVWQATSYYTIASMSSITLQYIAAISAPTGIYTSTTCAESYYTLTPRAPNSLDISAPTAVTLERIEAEVDSNRLLAWTTIVSILVAFGILALKFARDLRARS